MKIKKPRTPKIYNSPNIPYLEVDLKNRFRVSRLDKIYKKEYSTSNSNHLRKIRNSVF